MVADRLHLRHPMNPDYLRFRYSCRTMPKMTGDKYTLTTWRHKTMEPENSIPVGNLKWEHDKKLLRLLAKGEQEIRAGAGHDLDEVMAEAKKIISDNPLPDPPEPLP